MDDFLDLQGSIDTEFFCEHDSSNMQALLETAEPLDPIPEELFNTRDYVIFSELIDGYPYEFPVANNRVLNAVFAGDLFSNSNYEPITSNFPILYALELDELAEQDAAHSSKKTSDFYDFDFSKHFSLGKDFGAEGLNLVPNLEDDSSEPSKAPVVKRPKNAYFVFCTEQINKLKEEGKTVRLHERVKEYGALWKAMTALEKKPYIDEQRRLSMELKKKHPGYTFSKRKHRKYEIDGVKVGRQAYNWWKRGMKKTLAQGESSL